VLRHLKYVTQGLISGKIHTSAVQAQSPTGDEIVGHIYIGISSDEKGSCVNRPGTPLAEL